MDDNHVIIQGGLDTLRFEPQIDSAYEQDLRSCHVGRHKKLISFRVKGLEVLVCTMCTKRFEETP